MNLEALRAAVRTDADDHGEAKDKSDALLKDAAIDAWLNEGEEEACIRANLLFESTLEQMCVISVEPGQQSYPLDPRWITITKAYLTKEGSDCAIHLHLTSREALDRIRPNWRTEARDPTGLMQYDTRVEFDAPIAEAWTLHLEGYRLPIQPMVKKEDAPEIGRIHHTHLRHWALHRGYAIPDSEIFNPDKSAKALAAFTAVFGLRPDADLRKTQQQDVPHHNLAYW